MNPLDSTPPEGTDDRASLDFDEIEDTAVLVAIDPRKLTPEQRARRKRFLRQREIVRTVEVHFRKLGWKAALAVGSVIAIEFLRVVLDWMVHR